MTVEAHHDMLALVRIRLARRLGGEDDLTWIGDDEPLASAGIDSVLLIGVIGALESELGVALADDAVLEAASIGSLASALTRGERV